MVVLVTEYGRSAADTRSPEAQTVGSGELFAYVNGRVIHGRWDRPDVAKPATLVDDAGQPVLLSPGQTTRSSCRARAASPRCSGPSNGLLDRAGASLD
ncbi:MAG: DUF3048 C-terminal domain-containing protein [Acidimicrobiales bacterium]